MIYLIEEIWTDWMENRRSDAVGYKPIGYVQTEEDALAIVASGKMCTKEDCWACGTGMPQFRYKEIKRLF